MRIKIKTLLLILSLSITLAHAQTQAVRVFTLSADDWAQPRSGQVVASFVSVKNAVDYWQKTLGSVLLIRYPGEDSGELWASELKDWMVSLGVPNDSILLASGLDHLDEVEIIVATEEMLNY